MNNYNNVKKIINCIYEQRTDKNNFKKNKYIRQKLIRCQNMKKQVFKKKILKVSTYINRVIKFLEKMK